MTGQAAGLLVDYLDLLADLDRSQPVLDLACGAGRNGLLLCREGVQVVFADQSAAALEIVERQLAGLPLPGSVWQVDLEGPVDDPFTDMSFAAMLVFNYLHRPLFPAIKNAIMPGGLVVYETFTVDQRRFGRPKNPDYLLPF